MRVLVFCEARADFETATTLIDRVLLDTTPWTRDLLDSFPDAVRTWLCMSGAPFVDLHDLHQEARRRRLRGLHGHFGGRPGQSGALMARTAFAIARDARDLSIDAVVLIWDADGDARDRREGLDQARREAAAVPFAIALGLADRMREAWVLAGFEPVDEGERSRLASAAKDIGFLPHEEPHRLQDADEGSARNAKRVLSTLIADAPDRERCCLTDAPLSVLRSRGEGAGLNHFLDEIAQNLVPLADPTPRPN